MWRMNRLTLATLLCAMRFADWHCSPDYAFSDKPIYKTIWNDLLVPRR